MRPILDLIAKAESRGDYNAISGLVRRKDYPSKPLVKMTIGEVLEWQDRIDPHYLSEAAGRYQIMEDTLRGLYREAGLSSGELFNEANQDALCMALLRRRGLDDWRAMRISTVKFANNLAREWAGLPVVSGPKAGRSFYAGDGLNSATVSSGEVLGVLNAIRAPAKRGFWSAIWPVLKAIFNVGARLWTRINSRRSV